MCVVQLLNQSGFISEMFQHDIMFLSSDTDFSRESKLSFVHFLQSSPTQPANWLTQPKQPHMKNLFSAIFCRRLINTFSM